MKNKYKLVSFIEWRSFTGDLYRTGNYRFETNESGDSILINKKTKELVAYREHSFVDDVICSYIISD